MADAVDKDSKTEDATEKKIRDTVEQGKLPHSREATILASFVAILVFTVFYAKDSIIDLGMFLSMFLEKPEAWPMDTETDVIALYKIVMIEVGRAVVSLLVLLVVAGAGARCSRTCRNRASGSGRNSRASRYPRAGAGCSARRALPSS
jgi:flagellar biosynthetic protein FlhB